VLGRKRFRFGCSLLDRTQVLLILS
jgi:hypothetical protein